MFDNTDTFVKYFNEVMSSNGHGIRMKYTASLYEIKIQLLDGINFSLEDIMMMEHSLILLVSVD